MNYTSLILDVASAIVLLVCLISGAKRGFILTVGRLVTVLLAYIGAGILARNFGPKVGDLIQPYLSNIKLPAVLSEETLSHFDFAGINVGALDTVREVLGSTFNRIAERIISGIAQSLGYSLVAAVSFIVLVLIFRAIIKAIDLVSKLPVLRTVNGLLGFLAGLATGAVILLAAAWILGRFDAYVTPEVVEGTYLYKYFANAQQLFALFR